MNDQTADAAIEAALHPGRFFVTPPGRLRISRVECQRLPWEIFRGHLLSAGQTRHTCEFVAWHVYVDIGEDPAPEPLVSILHDRDAARIYVTRQILTHGFEPYEDAPGVILSRPAEKWLRELVGTVEIERHPHACKSSELPTCLMLAVVGTCRLPITSLESPLPAFSLGQFAYLPSLAGRSTWWSDPVAMLAEALAANLPPLEQSKALEFALRAAPPAKLHDVARVIEADAQRSDQPARRVNLLIRGLFNHLALSPYTEFADRMIDLLARLAASDAVGTEAIVDLLSTMLVQLCRHLTAFDLTLFHNYGANYPDALFLDGLLKTCLRLLETHPGLFRDHRDDDATLLRAKRIRRRALRQACLVRKHYEGHAVPDAPTSMGENLRVLPAPFACVPQEQITEMRQRRKTLYAGEPLENLLSPAAREVLHASIADLSAGVELLELGAATFLDRPLGIAKEPGEVDRTPLVSHRAFSRAIAKRRLQELHAAGWSSAAEHAALMTLADEAQVVGVPVVSLALVERPGVVSLADALKVSPDFVLVRTNRSSIAEIQERYDFGRLVELLPDVMPGGELRHVVLAHHAPRERGSAPMLRLYDDRARLRAELGFALGPARAVVFVERSGVELPARL